MYAKRFTIGAWRNARTLFTHHLFFINHIIKIYHEITAWWWHMHQCHMVQGLVPEPDWVNMDFGHSEYSAFFSGFFSSSFSCFWNSCLCSLPSSCFSLYSGIFGYSTSCFSCSLGFSPLGKLGFSFSYSSCSFESCD